MIGEKAADDAGGRLGRGAMPVDRRKIRLSRQPIAEDPHICDGEPASAGSAYAAARSTTTRRPS
jgi:hypothetical protein